MGENKNPQLDSKQIYDAAQLQKYTVIARHDAMNRSPNLSYTINTLMQDRYADLIKISTSRLWNNFVFLRQVLRVEFE
jgi:hypothetical protein